MELKKKTFLSDKYIKSKLKEFVLLMCDGCGKAFAKSSY
jgi:uncharacterized cysteine cluster protein YcgN (CxxCxxCC family)